MVARKLLFSCLFLAAFFPLGAQERPLGVLLEPDPVGVRDNTSLVVDLPLSSTAGVDVILPELPPGVALWRGPYVRSFQGPDYEARGYTQFVRVSFTFRSETSGWKVFPPFVFTAGGRRFESEPLLLGVGLYRGGALSIPFEPYWDLPDRSVFAGESVPVALRIPMQREVLLADEVRVEPPREGFFEPSDRVGTIGKRNISGFTFYDLSAAGYLLTPERAGRLTIPSALVRIGSLNGQAESRVIEVLPLPDSAASTGAVGRFDYYADVERDSLLEGERFFVDVVVSGTGNLPYLIIPEPDVSGADFSASSGENDITAGEEGFTGSRRIRYEYVVSGGQDIRITFPPFPFVVPGTGRTVTRAIAPASVSVQQRGGEPSAGEETPFPYEPRLLTGRTTVNQDSYRQPQSYLWLLPGPLLFLFFLLFGKKKRPGAALPFLLFFLVSAALPTDGGNTISDSVARRAYDDGEDEAAFLEYRALLEEVPGHPVLLYNCAVTAYRAGRVGDAVYYARSAYRSAPSDARIQALIRTIEEREGFGFQAALPFSVHPDFFFFLLMTGVNGAGFIGVFYLLHRRSVTFIASVLLLSIALFSAAALAFSAADWSSRVAVAAAEIPVRTIPDPDAAIVFRLREGEAVRVTGEAAGCFFIETGIDTGGWVPFDLVKVIDSRER